MDKLIELFWAEGATVDGGVMPCHFEAASMTTTTKTPRTGAPQRRAPQPRPDSEQTRERILDSAEKLFARHGFHGTSIRDIATDADYQFALVGYHFGSKLELMDRVLGRRAEVLNAERLSFLEQARARSKGAAIPVRMLVEGYVGTIVARASKNDAGWRNYTQLVGTAAGSAEWAELTDRHFNAVAREYLDELQRSLPKVPSEALHQAFFFAVGAMVTACARPGRIETLSRGKFKSKELATMYENLCTFLEGGFKAVAGQRPDPG
jgi:AcrR family transcriptional regulator